MCAHKYVATIIVMLQLCHDYNYTHNIYSTGCINRFVRVAIDLTASTLTCRFRNNQSSVEKTCSVEYSLCGQEQVFKDERNSTLESPDWVILQFTLPSRCSCYTYTVRASNGTNTVVIEEKVDSG